MTTTEDLSTILPLSQQFVLENYGRVPLAMVRGEGSYLWDSTGKRYLDFFVGFGAGGVAGHCHPKIVEAVQQQAATLFCHGNLFTNPPQTFLAQKLVEHSFPGQVFFCHSGTEANETAIKLVRKATSEGRYKIISFENSFHGRTMGALSLTPPSFQKGFDPMLEGNVMLPHGDLEAVAKAIDDTTAGIFIEPIQGEGGVNEASVEFMVGLRKLCDKHEILLVCDEVWNSPARTGKWFSHQYYEIQPDVMTLAKALGGGLPIAACIVAKKWQDVLGPGSHGCTMGGNPLCAAAALATVSLVEDEKLGDRAVTLGEHAKSHFQKQNLSSVKEVKGKGLMLGLALDESTSAAEVVTRAREAGLIVCTAKNNVVRIAPALVIDEELLSEGLKILADVIRGIETA